MKKFIGLVLAIFILIFCTACDIAEVETVDKPTKQTSMFVVIEYSNNGWKIVYHKDTKVMYAVSYGNYNNGTFTLLVDENGNPLLWQG